MLFTSVRANNNAPEELVHRWYLNRAMRNTRLGRVSAQTTQKKWFNKTLGILLARSTIFALLDGTSK